MFSRPAEATVSIQGTLVPRIGLGTYEIVGQDCVNAVRQALDIGYRHFDTARVYNNEHEVGLALQESGIARNEVFLTTKIWTTDFSPQRVPDAVHGSLTRLQTEYIDLLLLHWPEPSVPIASTLEALRREQEAGHIRHIGVSNFTPRLLSEACEYAPIFCNQVEYHPFLDQSRLLTFLNKKNILLTAYGPLAAGHVFQDATLREIGEKYEKSAGQIALRWLLDHSLVAVIPRSRQLANQKKNFDVFDFTLTEEDRSRIAQLAQGMRIYDLPWAPDWND